jgi:hypothetical protein
MAVNADWSAVQDYESLHENKYEWALTEGLCASVLGYGLLFYLGVSGLNDKNIGEACARLDVLNGLGAWKMRRDGTPTQVTKNDLIRRIGMFTNYESLTRHQWVKKILTPILDSVSNDVTEKVTTLTH